MPFGFQWKPFGNVKGDIGRIKEITAMLLMDANTLARYFVRGDLTKNEFVSLSSSLEKLEQIKQSDRFFSRLVGIIRCSVELLRYSIKLRAKTTWRFIKYCIIACAFLLLTVIYRVDIVDIQYLANTDADMNQFLELVINGSPEKLPDDMRRAAEIMSTNKQWQWQHVRQLKNLWNDISEQKRLAIRKTHWFQAFYLMALLKEAEYKKLAHSSVEGSLNNVTEIRSLVSTLS